MRRRKDGKWPAIGAAILCAVFVSGDRSVTLAEEKSQESNPVPDGIAEARSLVKALETRVRVAEADLSKAKAILSSLEGTSAVAKVENDDTKSVEGIWRIVSIDGNRNNGAFRKPPYDEYKIMSAGHYLWLSFNPETGSVLRSGGGTYSLKGDVYTAHVDYSNATDLRAVASQEYVGTSRLEGNRLYHFGKITNGASFDELWEKVNQKP